CCLSNHSRHENVKLCVQQQISIAERMAEVFEAHSKVNGDSETTTTKFIDSLKIPYIALCFGDVESIVDQPTIVSYCFGVEDFEDLQSQVPTRGELTSKLPGDGAEDVEPGNKPSPIEIIKNVHKRQKEQGEWRDS
ncbi:hypothetical protein Tco_1374363, partial [Tanacetum coccineum]